ncbi:MAG: hypothetical protein A2320_04100 [Pseudomonadales bacterium GWC2_63_15]|nr:MAG: hypothetical protein A2320_04100 [Pseudomonadales bacterium GWC2_63_15]
MEGFFYGQIWDSNVGAKPVTVLARQVPKNSAEAGLLRGIPSASQVKSSPLCGVFYLPNMGFEQSEAVS